MHGLNLVSALHNINPKIWPKMHLLHCASEIWNFRCTGPWGPSFQIKRRSFMLCFYHHVYQIQYFSVPLSMKQSSVLRIESPKVSELRLLPELPVKGLFSASQGGWSAILLFFSDWLLLNHDKNTSSNPHFLLLLYKQNILLCTLMLEMQMVFRIPWVWPIKYAKYVVYFIGQTQGILNTICISNIRVQSSIFCLYKRSKKCGLLLVFLSWFNSNQPENKSDIALQPPCARSRTRIR